MALGYETNYTNLFYAAHLVTSLSHLGLKINRTNVFYQDLLLISLWHLDYETNISNLFMLIYFSISIAFGLMKAYQD
jgi:hypothetical protein